MEDEKQMGGNRKMILEYETLCEKLKEVEDSDAYWECVIVETGCFCKNGIRLLQKGLYLVC